MQIKSRIASPLLFLIMIGLLLVTILFSDNYLFTSFGFLLLAFLFIIFRFEKRKLEARELVLLAVLAAIATIVRIPFASIPFVKPTTFVIMISGFVFGAESGFMIGVVAAIASNMILGQGPWTPWQMMAWGLVGLTAGLLNKSSFLVNRWGKIIFGILWGFLFGWIMNIWAFLSFSQSGESLNVNSFFSFMAGSVVFDFMHSFSNVIFLLLFGDVWIKILTRFKRKYGFFDK